MDGVNDEGFGDVVVYYRVGLSKAGAVESTLLPDFTERVNHPDHQQRWYFIGHGDSAVRFLRYHKILNQNNRVPARLRANIGGINNLRDRCRSYVQEEKTHTYEFRAKDFTKRYNGNGFRGTGGPKAEWLRMAVNEYLQKYYPELQCTLLKTYFSKKDGWKLVFTVPYWASSQPIEQVWAYIKNYVALRWFKGRRMNQLRSQILCGMYGVEKAGDIVKCWTEPKGLAAHSGLTPELAIKFINHSYKAINEFINGNRFIKHMGEVGQWRQGDIDRLVLPPSGGMDIDEHDIIYDDVAETDIINDINNEDI